MSVLSMLPTLISAGSAIYGAIRGNKNEQKAQQQQVQDQREMNEEARKGQLDMWKKTNFAEQRKQLEKAGMNTGLLYGLGGAGGATAGQAPTGSASKANVHKVETGEIAQLGLMNAQKELVEAQTQKTQAETEKTSGVDTKATESQTQNTIADTAIKNIRALVEGETKYDTINKIKEEAQKAMHEANSAGVKSAIDERTQVEVGDRIISEAVGAMLENQVKKQGLKMSQAQINKIATDIEQGWEKLRLESKGQDVSRENMEQLTETMLWQSGINATGNLVKGIMDVKKIGVKR